MQLSVLCCLAIVVSGCGAVYTTPQYCAFPRNMHSVGRISSDPCGDGCILKVPKACGQHRLTSNTICRRSRELLENQTLAPAAAAAMACVWVDERGNVCSNNSSVTLNICIRREKHPVHLVLLIILEVYGDFEMGRGSLITIDPTDPGSQKVEERLFNLGRVPNGGGYNGIPVKLTMDANSSIRLPTSGALLHGDIYLREGARLVLRGQKGLSLSRLTLFDRSRLEVFCDHHGSGTDANVFFQIDSAVILAADSNLAINATSYCQLSSKLLIKDFIRVMERGLNCNLTILRPNNSDFGQYPSLTLGRGTGDCKPYYNFKCV